MPRPGMHGKNEKANNFQKAIKRLLSNLKKYRILILIAIILAASSSVLSLVSPNKLKDITNIISNGLTIKEDKLTKLTTSIFNNLTDKDKLTNKINNIMADESISQDDKKAFQEVISLMESSSEEEKLKYVLSIPESIMLNLLEDINIDNNVITKYDQIDTLKVLSNINDDSKNILKQIDNLPTSVSEIIKPSIDIETIKSISILLLIIYIISSMFGFIESFILNTVSNRFAQNLRERISKKINKLPLKYFDNHEMGDILSRVTNDIDSVGTNLDNSLSSLVSSITLFIGCLIMMFYTSPVMAITAILSTIIGFSFMTIILSKSQKYFNEKQVELGKLNSHIEEIYSGHTIVKAYNGEEDAYKEFTKLNKNLYNCNLKSQFLSGLMPSLMGFVGNFGYVAVCLVGAILVLNNKISFGVIVAFMIYVRLFTSPLSQMAQALSALQSVAAASERVFDFLDEEEMSMEKDIRKRLDGSKINGEIEFKNVKFGYDPKKLIIKDFNVKVLPGQKVAIVGPTGAGKTTMVNLLMKFYEINSGDILIDGVSTKELSRDNIHRLFTMVLQDTWIFHGTVRDNIKFNRKNITDEEVWQSLRIVGVDHFIQTLPGGIDAIIDDGEAVSLGEKQLLTIARGMIEDAPFLILDEATSNVDTRTEELVQKAMDKLTVGRTSFIIAHRLSTIKNADIILVMNEGNIVEAGNHDSLMKKNGFYAELYNSQFTKVS